MMPGMNRRQALLHPAVAAALAAWAGPLWPRPARPAPGLKVLRLASESETGFDPARVGDVRSLRITSHIFEPLLEFDPLARPVERLLYRLARVDETHEMRWAEYGAAMLLFSLVSFVVLYAVLRLQSWQPWGNPQALGPVPPYLAFNTAVSFTTNTNWQAYGGESTVSYLTQMAGLAYQNFMSAAAGIALAVAFVRGIARRESATLGNFWVDLTRALLWVLLPLCLVGSLALVSQGVVQNFKPYDRAALVALPPDLRRPYAESLARLDPAQAEKLKKYIR